jgi:RNA polymerase sigma factor (sigma-70 family)
MGGHVRATPTALVDSTTSYFAQMGAVRLLTPATELELARRIEEGDRQILVALLGSRIAVDELLRAAAEGTTTRSLAGEILVDVDPRHVSFDEAARKRELGDVLAALQRYRDAQDEPFGLDRARATLLRRLSLQWFRAGVLARAVATLRAGTGARRTQGALIKAVRLADDARADMLRANLRLVVSVARQYRNRGVELLDLVQEGNLGLMKAIDKFDHRRGFRLATYATWWIRVAISCAIADGPRTIRIPASMRSEISRVTRATIELTRTLGRPPVDEEIADRLGLSLERVRRVGDVPGEPLSLEMPVGSDESATLQDFLEDRQAASPAQSLYATDLVASVQSALSVLTDREAKVVRLRFGIGKADGQTLEEIGQLFGVTRERIRQIEEKALAKLRRRRVAGRLRPHLEA